MTIEVNVHIDEETPHSVRRAAFDESPVVQLDGFPGVTLYFKDDDVARTFAESILMVVGSRKTELPA